MTKETADTVMMPTDHSNWRNYTRDDIDLIFMHPENQWEERVYKVRLDNYLYYNEKTLGQMVDVGPAVWCKEPNIGRKTANIFMSIINNLAGEKVVWWPQNKPEKVEFDKKEEERKKQLRAAVYEMRMKYHKSWKEIADMCGVSPPTVRLWDKQHRLENDLPSKYVDNLNQQLVDLRNDIHSLKSDFYLLAKYLRNNNNHEVAHLIEQRLERKR